MHTVSIQNIHAADYARIEAFSKESNAVSLFKDGKISYLHDENGDLLLFPTYFEAFNAVFKIRCDIPFNQRARALFFAR